MATLRQPRGLDDFVSSDKRIGMEAKTSALISNRDSTANVTGRSGEPSIPLFVAPRSCVGRWVTVVNPVADGKHSMTEKLKWENI